MNALLLSCWNNAAKHRYFYYCVQLLVTDLENKILHYEFLHLYKCLERYLPLNTVKPNSVALFAYFMYFIFLVYWYNVNLVNQSKTGNSLFLFGCPEGNITLSITSELTNENTWKVLFTCVALDLPQVDLWEVDLFRLKGFHLRFAPKWGVAWLATGVTDYIWNEKSFVSFSQYSENVRLPWNS